MTVERYHRLVDQARLQFPQKSGLVKLLSRDASEDLLFAFLIEFACRGVAITKPVDQWIRAAGTRCREIGLEVVGARLIGHARDEAGHHVMHMKDARALVHLWNASGRRPLDAAEFLARPVGGAALEYIELHESIIASEQPYRQVALEREIEGLSVSGGTKVVDVVRERLGQSVVDALTFLTEHVDLDEGHTAFNDRLLAEVLKARPDALPQLADTGVRVLEIYAGVVQECLEFASGLVKSQAAWSSRGESAVVPGPSTGN